MHFISVGVCACGYGGMLVNGRCGWCGDEAARPAPRPLARPATVASALELLVAELEAEEVAAPLAQRFTLASIAADLCRLAGEPVPAAVLDALDGPAATPLYREPYAEPA